MYNQPHAASLLAKRYYYSTSYNNAVGISVGAIIAIVVCVVLVKIAIIVAICVCISRHRKRKQQISAAQQNVYPGVNQNMQTQQPYMRNQAGGYYQPPIYGAPGQYESGMEATKGMSATPEVAGQHPHHYGGHYSSFGAHHHTGFGHGGDHHGGHDSSFGASAHHGGSFGAGNNGT